MYRYLVIFLAPALLFLSAGCSSESESGSSAESAAAIAGYEISPINMSRIVRASATIEPENVITIAGRMSGLINEMKVREGDRIEAGEIIIRFDIEEQQAELTRARAELDLANAIYERNRTLFDRDAISVAEYEESRANRIIAESDVRLLETRVNFGTVRAPQTVTVLRRHVEEGDAITANQPLIQAANLDRLVVRVGIPERDVVNLNSGQRADFTIDAYPDQLFSGTIERIYPSADPNSRLFTVEIATSSAQQDRVIRPGYLARVTMDADRRENVLAVPSESLLASGRDERFVYVINNENRLERRDITTGIERRNWTQVLDGLQEGEIIAGANPSNLRENQLVRVTRWVDDGSPEVAQIN